MNMKELRPYQASAIEQIRIGFFADGKRRQMLYAPTAFGKTVLAVNIIRMFLKHNKTVAFVVPVLSLIDQTVRAFEFEGIDKIGVVQADHPRTDPSQPIQVCSIQTIGRREDKPNVDFVIVDEAHLLHEPVFEWMAENENLWFLGLSATPWSKGLGKHYDNLIVSSTTAELIRDGYLAPFKVFAPLIPDLTGVKIVRGDYHEKQLADIIDRPDLTSNVVSTWKDKANGVPTLCYAINRAHARHLQEQLLEKNIKAAYIDGLTKREEGEDIFEQLRRNETEIICSVATMEAGIDLPMVACIIDARPTKSEIRYVQTIGRGLRTFPGKDHLLVLDHAGNCLRHGFVTDIVHRKLHNGSKEDTLHYYDLVGGGQNVKRCPACGAVMEKNQFTCDCGNVIESPELVEVKWDISPRQFYAEILWLCEDRGFKEGWAAHKFKTKYGIWPKCKNVSAAEPSAYTLAFDKKDYQEWKRRAA